MRWCSFTTLEPDALPRLGAVGVGAGGAGTAVLDVGAWGRAQGDGTPTDLVDLVAACPETQERVTSLVLAASPEGSAWLPAAGVRLLAPLRAPNSLRDFLTFGDHVQRGAERRGVPVPPAWDRIPVFYKGNRRSIVGPDEVVPWPSYTERMDFECEVAAVLGRGGRDVPVEQAGEHIFGYTIMNDWSARDVQREEMSCWLGPAKAKDFATTLGPWLVTPDEWSPEEPHAMEVVVDGETWSRGTTTGRRWTFAAMVAWASRDEDLYATDVLGSGTYGGGCGLDLDRWLPPECVVTLRVQGLGELSNRVVKRH